MTPRSTGLSLLHNYRALCVCVCNKDNLDNFPKLPQKPYFHGMSFGTCSGVQELRMAKTQETWHKMKLVFRNSPYLLLLPGRAPPQLQD